LSALALVLIVQVGCGGGPPKTGEAAGEEGTRVTDSRGFDPLELPRDREIIPDRYPRSGAILGRSQLMDSVSQQYSEGPDSLFVRPPTAPIDTINNQAYRVQLVTSNVNGEARRAAAVAEEMFDQPVYLDYEVPNYKVRVGSFAHRDDAEQYRQKARAAGYSNAWVVMVNLKIKKLTPLYDDLPLVGPPLPADSTDAIPDSLDSDGDF